MSARLGFLAAAVSSCLLAGCAAEVERPTEAMTRAQTLISQAEQNGAQRFAAAELEQARDKLRRADEASDDGKNEVAARLANEAVLDAELAAARASSGEAQRAAEEIRKSVETLQQEANRQPGALQPQQPVQPQ